MNLAGSLAGRNSARPLKAPLHRARAGPAARALNSTPYHRFARGGCPATAPIGRRPGCSIARSASATSQSSASSVKITGLPGSPEPLGPSRTSFGVNFAVYSAHASAMKLCLFDESNEPITELEMKRTGDVWHIEAADCPLKGVLYGVRVFGDGGWEVGHRWDSKRVMLDPYTPLISGRRKFGVRDEIENYERGFGSTFRGTFDLDAPPYNWEGVESPNYPLRDLVIYEVPVRTFTAAASSGLPAGERGTFRGLAAKAAHLKSLGINAVELLPVFEYDELEFQRDSNPREHMVNVWGYSHIAFFAPMSRFAADGAGAVAAAREFKDMVKTLHKNGIEVILDVVYNHTAEGSDVNPYTLCHRGVDCLTYYQMNLNQYEQILNYSGCGNTINGNNPAVKEQIVASLRHWVEEYHVDGFRFDLATALCRDSHGNLLKRPPLIAAIAKDPVLSKKKLIAEPWDIGGYQVGSFPNWDVWSEWNGIYRDVVRRFIKGDVGVKAEFATRIAGSADLYNNHHRRASDSINFVVAHDGFTLRDLVSYNDKHNEANGEGGRDGTNDNLSWNHGVEGETDDAGINALRWRQMRNFMVALMLSQGTPMIVSGDEFGHTRGGNNNWYGHDNEMSQFDWEPSQEQQDFFDFVSQLIKFRRECPLLGKDEFLGPKELFWHEENWDNGDSKFIAFTLFGKKHNHPDVYCAFNAHSGNVSIPLPTPPEGTFWSRLVDTNLPPERVFVPGGNKGVEPTYSFAGRSAVILITKPLSEE